MNTEKLLLAAVLAIAAAARLVLWRWHVRRDCEWLAKRFGASEDDEEIAEAHSMLWAAGLALAAVVVLYA